MHHGKYGRQGFGLGGEQKAQGKGKGQHELSRRCFGKHVVPDPFDSTCCYQPQSREIVAISVADWTNASASSGASCLGVFFCTSFTK